MDSPRRPVIQFFFAATQHKLKKSCTVSDSAVDPFVPLLFDLYVGALNDGDAVLQSLSLLGLSYFLGTRMDSPGLDRIATILLHLLSKEELADDVVQDIGKFLNTAAQSDGSWVTEKMIPQLFGMLRGGNAKTSSIHLRTRIKFACI